MQKKAAANELRLLRRALGTASALKP